MTDVRDLLAALTFTLSPVVADSAEVTVAVTGASGDGLAFVGLCSGGLERDNCSRGQTARTRAGAAKVVFRNVPDGVYAVAAFQDENGDRQLNRSALGLPLERYGFSNDAGRAGPPRFRNAAFTVRGDVVIRLRLGPPPFRG